MDKRTYRMYGLVPYNLSPIQQGIQFGHAVVEYAQRHFSDADYQHWACNDKTFIILNGGTTNTFVERLGTLNQYAFALGANQIKHELFFEPDLGDQLTAVAFLVDDRVFDREAWPDYDGIYFTNGKPAAHPYHEWKMKFSEDEKEADTIVWLRDWLRNFKLA